jgi:L-amino acid N-acyltransferase YncA
MVIERQPGYEQWVGRWTEAQHHHNLATAGYLYFVHDDARGVPTAFACISGLGGRDGEVYLNRLIVGTPGNGTGALVLRAIMATVFDGAPTSRMLLRVRPENERALALYRGHGFKQLKMLPQGGTTPDGQRVDLLLLAIDYEDWAVRNSD